MCRRVSSEEELAQRATSALPCRGRCLCTPLRKSERSVLLCESDHAGATGASVEPQNLQ